MWYALALMFTGISFVIYRITGNVFRAFSIGGGICTIFATLLVDACLIDTSWAIMYVIIFLFSTVVSRSKKEDMPKRGKEPKFGGGISGI